jgi:tetratricopeptide (TPR) repeat protein
VADVRFLGPLRKRALAPILSGLLCACADPAADSVRRGDQLLFEGHYSEAAHAYELALTALAEDGDGASLGLHGETLAKLGEVRQYYLNDAQGALRAYRAVAELNVEPEEAFRARLSAARLLRDRVGDLTAAESELVRLLDRFPDRPHIGQLRLELAQLAFRIRDYAQARVQAQRVFDSKEASLMAEAGLLLASIHQEDGDMRGALALYGALLKSPLDEVMASRVRFEAAHCTEALGNLEGALRLYEAARAGSFNPDLVEAKLARVQERLDLTTRALSHVSTGASVTSSIRP